MKTLLRPLWVLAIFISLVSFSETVFAQNAEQVLRKTSEKLTAAKSLSFIYKRELNYASEGYQHSLSGEAYLDLKPEASRAGFKYQFSTPEMLAIYNGSERFYLDKNKLTQRVETGPGFNTFRGETFLYNSLVTLKYALPNIVADQTIPKSLSEKDINGVKYFVAEFSLRKAALSAVGEIETLTLDRLNIYRVAIDKKTYLPVEVYLSNDKNKDFTRTEFSGIREKPELPAENTWYYSTYSSEYKPEKNTEAMLLKAGETAPVFDLKLYDAAARISLEGMKGRLVLLEFWIAHCGYCIAAVPKINALKEKFKGLDVLAINVQDTDQTIALFKENNGPKYPILTGGVLAARVYGAGVYPTFVLIGKDGKILYTKAGTDFAELEKMIAQNL